MPAQLSFSPPSGGAAVHQPAGEEGIEHHQRKVNQAGLPGLQGDAHCGKSLRHRVDDDPCDHHVVKKHRHGEPAAAAEAAVIQQPVDQRIGIPAGKHHDANGQIDDVFQHLKGGDRDEGQHRGSIEGEPMLFHPFIRRCGGEVIEEIAHAHGYQRPHQGHVDGSHILPPAIGGIHGFPHQDRGGQKEPPRQRFIPVEQPVDEIAADKHGRELPQGKIGGHISVIGAE